MRITKRQLRRIIREEVNRVNRTRRTRRARQLSEVKADGLEFEATFIWDDYFDTGEPYKETRTVFLDADDLDRYEDEGFEGTYDFAMRWAEDNLDGAMDISHVEISA